MRSTRGFLVELGRIRTPLDGRLLGQAKGSLVVDVDTISASVGNGDDVDVVGRVGSGRLDGGRLRKTRVTLSVALDVLVDPITNGSLGASVRRAGVDGRLGLGDRGQDEASSNGGGGLCDHDCLKLRSKRDDNELAAKAKEGKEKEQKTDWAVGEAASALFNLFFTCSSRPAGLRRSYHYGPCYWFFRPS